MWDEVMLKPVVELIIFRVQQKQIGWRAVALAGCFSAASAAAAPAGLM